MHVDTSFEPFVLVGMYINQNYYAYTYIVNMQQTKGSNVS